MSEEEVTLVGDRTGLTAYSEVRKGVMVTSPNPPPTKTDRGWGAAVRTVGTEVGRRRKNRLIGWMGEKNIREDMPSSAHSEDMPSRSHSDYMPLSAHDDQPQSLNNIKCSSKTKFLKGYTYYILDSTFASS